jgi:hypothetical protein
MEWCSNKTSCKEGKIKLNNNADPTKIPSPSDILGSNSIPSPSDILGGNEKKNLLL